MNFACHPVKMHSPGGCASSAGRLKRFGLGIDNNNNNNSNNSDSNKSSNSNINNNNNNNMPQRLGGLCGFADDSIIHAHTGPAAVKGRANAPRLEIENVRRCPNASARDAGVGAHNTSRDA